MKRNLNGLEGRKFDLAIIGGGVIGACIARDAARRGLSVALVEMNDFASAASEAMSHMIHGGMRYLAQGRFGMVREALREKDIWLRTAPDFVVEQKFIMPLPPGLRGLRMKAGVALYQRMAVRRAAFLTAREAGVTEPCLAGGGFSGASVYHDARIDDPHGLIIALLQDAAAHGAGIANHASCAGLMSASGRVTGIRCRDGLTGEAFSIAASQVVNASGPWGQAVAGMLLPGQKLVKMMASKGIHLIISAMTKSYAIALSGKGEHAFILPWQGMNLVGTTDDVLTGDAGQAGASPEEIERLKAKLIRLLPAARPPLDKALDSYAGVRAMPGAAGGSYRASREEAIIDHGGEGMRGLHSVLGGKWTTARRIAEKFLDRIAPDIERALPPCDTAEAQIPDPPAGGAVPALLQRASDEGMAVTAADFRRRLGRGFAFSDPSQVTEAETWLASRGLGPDSAQVTEEVMP
jgi:glycerol-3-phosphate dehydrogenase